jgi:hypothetical protein
MRGAYKILANLIALLVVVQAAVMVWAIAGLGIWVDEGGTFDKSVMESDEMPFDEIVGLIIHGMNGMMLIPLVSLILLVVSFFAKVPRGIPVAAGLLVLIVLQVVLGLFGHEVALSGLLHGVNALIIFAGALHAGRLASRTVVVEKREPAPTATA